MPLPSPLHAPEINRPGLTWLNCAAPLNLADLRGKLVVLDFWTFCCINCIHILPMLQKLEASFAEEVVVIGVHSPKFSAEKSVANVADAVARYGIQHPIIHDPDFILWKQYQINAWPTLVFIDPHGRIIGQQAGEPEPLHLLNGVRDMLDYYEKQGALQPKPFAFTPAELPATKLLFPAKIKPLPMRPEATSSQPPQWVVADSGHNQLVVFADDGHEITRYGSGEKGCLDGTAHTASFNAPQGLVANAAAIFVADTGNHAIRRIDRHSGAITTLAGDGGRGVVLLNKFEPALGRGLASPWDLALKDNILFFANAGTHQIGGIDLNTGLLRLVAGSSLENIQDGAVLLAPLAQPSGLVLNAAQDRLYFADSETSALRYIDFKQGTIHTVIGSGLFDFGHVNGPFATARLQHCLGLCLIDDTQLLIADSYNAAIRLVDFTTGMVSDLDANAWVCEAESCRPFAEPAGIWAASPNRILLSDTNNHRIMEINRTTLTMRPWNK